MNDSEQPRSLPTQSDPAGSACPTTTTASWVAGAASGVSNGGGRRTPGGIRTWRWAAGSAEGSVAVRRARRSQNGPSTPRVSPRPVTQEASVTSEPSQPATATSDPFAAASSGWTSATERTRRPATVAGKAGAGPAGGAGAGGGLGGGRGTGGRRGAGARRIRPGAGEAEPGHGGEQEQRDREPGRAQGAADRRSRRGGRRLDDHRVPVPTSRAAHRMHRSRLPHPPGHPAPVARIPELAAVEAAIVPAGDDAGQPRPAGRGAARHGRRGGRGRRSHRARGREPPREPQPVRLFAEASRRRSSRMRSMSASVVR